MTEDAKQTMLLVFQDMLRQGAPESEIQSFQRIHDQLLHDLTEQVPSELRTRLLTLPMQLQAMMEVTRAKLARTARIIAYIEQTPAAALTREAILQVT